MPQAQSREVPRRCQACCSANFQAGSRETETRGVYCESAKARVLRPRVWSSPHETITAINMLPMAPRRTINIRVGLTRLSESGVVAGSITLNAYSFRTAAIVRVFSCDSISRERADRSSTASARASSRSSTISVEFASAIARFRISSFANSTSPFAHSATMARSCQSTRSTTSPDLMSSRIWRILRSNSCNASPIVGSRPPSACHAPTLASHLSLKSKGNRFWSVMKRSNKYRDRKTPNASFRLPPLPIGTPANAARAPYSPASAARSPIPDSSVTGKSTTSALYTGRISNAAAHGCDKSNCNDSERKE